jgi:hypothetical protein
MQKYPDPERHQQKYIDDAAKKYVLNMQELEMEPTPIITKKYAERVAQEAEKDYLKKFQSVSSNNIEQIMLRHNKEMKRLDREGRNSARIFSPIAILLFLACTFYSLEKNDIVFTIVYGIAVLIFLIMWIIVEVKAR